MNVAKTIQIRFMLCMSACLVSVPAAGQEETAAAAEASATEVEVETATTAEATDDDTAEAPAEEPVVDAADSTPTSQIISEAPAEEEKVDEGVYTWTLGAGGNLATGNTETWGVFTGSNFNYKRRAHEFDAAYLFNFSRANVEDDYTTTAKNSTLQLRYNYWFTDNDAVYAGLSHRWDEFAGLDARIRADLGYARKLWETDVNLLKAEAGVAYIFDRRISGVDPRNQHNASLRLALGYIGNPNDNVKIESGLEFLDNINKLDETPNDIDSFKDVRVNWNFAITAKLWEKLAANVSFLLRYDAEPVATAEELDTQTVFSLIYTLL